jgi:hypothetical protein
LTCPCHDTDSTAASPDRLRGKADPGSIADARKVRMYAIVLRFHILIAGRLPSAEVLVESIQRVDTDLGRVEHVRAQRQSGDVIAIAFVTASDADGAVRLGERAAREVELSTLSLRLVSVRMLERPPGKSGKPLRPFPE